jgi:glutaconyl-CoA/methylmalonyl-CoA decarboxylase subunit gamma
MRRYTIEVAGKAYVIDVQELAVDRFRALILAEAVITPEMLPNGAHPATPAHRPVVAAPAATLPVVPAPAAVPKPAAIPAPARAPVSTNGHLRAEVRAPLPGVVTSIAVAPGTRVEQGLTVLMLEAMKMKNAIRAPQAGVVAEVLVQIGQTVRHGEVLLRIEQG